MAARLNPPQGIIRLGLFPSFQQALKAQPDCQEVWVDIPIGLSGGGVVRRLDAAMRAALKARKSSVFPAPSRAALAAGSYRQARELEQQAQARSLSAQAYHLIPKIREVDDFLQTQPDWRKRVFESHPELCFQRLNGDVPLAHSKKEAAGWEERAAVLEGNLAGIREMVLSFLKEVPRNQVQPDDALDALVLAVAAWLNQGERSHFLRQPEECDSAGIPLRIACPPPLRRGEKR
jgi:predicted RNase H-like nuclease